MYAEETSADLQEFIEVNQLERGLPAARDFAERVHLHNLIVLFVHDQEFVHLEVEFEPLDEVIGPHGFRCGLHAQHIFRPQVFNQQL